MEKLAILDCGGQYTKVIDRRVRELGVKSDIFPINVKSEDLKEYQAVILSGGPNNIGESQRLNFDKKMFRKQHFVYWLFIMAYKFFVFVCIPQKNIMCVALWSVSFMKMSTGIRHIIIL